MASRGYRVRICPTGREVLQALAEERPDVAILDWTLGDTTAEQLAKPFADQSVPIILTSGAGGSRDLGQRVGARAVLDKPFDLEKLFQTLQQLLGEAPEVVAHP